MIQSPSYCPRSTITFYVPIKHATWTPPYPAYDHHQTVPDPNNPNQQSPGNEPLTAGGASGLSETIDIGGTTIVEISAPANWTAAAITFMVVPLLGNDSLLYSLRNPDGSEFSITIAPSQTVTLNYLTLFSLDRFRLRSGTLATPVTQATDANLVLKVTQQIRL